MTDIQDMHLLPGEKAGTNTLHITSNIIFQKTSQFVLAA